jgi:hypothetical protein
MIRIRLGAPDYRESVEASKGVRMLPRPTIPDSQIPFTIKLFVMRGLDPRTHAYPPAQMPENRALRRRVGTRVKPAHDDL